jgi:hypothetical protein
VSVHPSICFCVLAFRCCPRGGTRLCISTAHPGTCRIDELGRVGSWRNCARGPRSGRGPTLPHRASCRPAHVRGEMSTRAGRSRPSFVFYLLSLRSPSGWTRADLCLLLSAYRVATCVYFRSFSFSSSSSDALLCASEGTGQPPYDRAAYGPGWRAHPLSRLLRSVGHTGLRADAAPFRCTPEQGRWYARARARRLARASVVPSIN